MSTCAGFVLSYRDVVVRKFDLHHIQRTWLSIQSSPHTLLLTWV
jgi:hypothetical protein